MLIMKFNNNTLDAHVSLMQFYTQTNLKMPPTLFLRRFFSPNVCLLAIKTFHSIWSIYGVRMLWVVRVYSISVLFVSCYCSWDISLPYLLLNNNMEKAFLLFFLFWNYSQIVYPCSVTKSSQLIILCFTCTRTILIKSHQEYREMP